MEQRLGILSVVLTMVKQAFGCVVTGNAGTHIQFGLAFAGISHFLWETEQKPCKQGVSSLVSVLGEVAEWSKALPC
ncbi:hypothetical protein [Phyllobacterium sophorae]|uniref:hypothetical protein n=1 Tax=Phyllobacterium sophorae TaxID=1520277 RepID=UPI00147626EC|nr:hypothetical protein [Phyllobacterium sophorae]